MILKSKAVDNSSVKLIKVFTVCIFADYIYPKLQIHNVVFFNSFPKISNVRAGAIGTDISSY